MRKLLRVFLILLALVALYFAYDFAKSKFIDWYADNFIPRPTAFPAADAPDQLALTWSDDPQTTQAVQWRTSTAVGAGFVQFRAAAEPESAAQEIPAARDLIEDKMVENDPLNHRFGATITGLQPGTDYLYRVGSREPDAWSEWRPFTTAPAGVEPFSFMYLGDVQNGFEYWGGLMQQAHGSYPEASFYVIAGDLVNNGDYRDQWDEFFAYSEGIFDRKPMMPALGNHDYDKKPEPWKYLQLFQLPENGPENLAPGRAYSFTYSNALFVVLDSNRALREQTPWLEEQLANSTATWKFVMYHHPAYVSKRHRENRYVRDTWGALFDQYGVDIALQGHDHAYLRTHPMREGKPVAPGEQGVVYLVSIAGDKYYEQEPWDYTEVGFTEISTYQVIDISTNPDRLSYRAYDIEGNVRDEFVLTKD